VGARRGAGTAASALRASGAWDFGTKRAFDAAEWWLRCRFDAEAAAPAEALVLRLDGLATLADVWLNGEHLLTSDNMFHAHVVDVTLRVREHNEIAIRFKSLTAALAQRRPRPRWRTRLVDQQQLRWFRTTLLGRIPGWTPPVAAVGAWRPITLERRTGLSVEELDVQTRVEGKEGVVRVRAVVRPLGRAAPATYTATLQVGDAMGRVAVRDASTGEIVVQGSSVSKTWRCGGRTRTARSRSIR